MSPYSRIRDADGPTYSYRQKSQRRSFVRAFLRAVSRFGNTGRLTD